MTSAPKLVSVHRASNPSEALVVQGVLEEAEIQAWIHEPNTPFPGVFWEQGVVGCDVWVRAEDLARAQIALQEARDSMVQDY